MPRGNKVGITGQFDDNVSGKLSKLRDEFDRLGKSEGAKSVLQGVGVGAGISAYNLLSQGLSTVIDGAFSAIQSASDLNETISKSDVIFGRNAGTVQAWAETMAASAGQSQRAALDAASGFAGLFKTVGIGLDQSTDMSKELTQLGSDLASFFNTDVDEALAALKSGLNGESEPLRRFNVFLSDAAVKAKAMELGLKPVNGQLTEAQKATARYQLILGQTTDAQGDFTRTQDDLANTQRTLNADLENLSATIGQELLPVMVEFASFARDEVVPALTDMVTVIKDNKDAIGFLADAIGFLANPLGSAGNAALEFSGAQEKLAGTTRVLADESQRLGRDIDRTSFDGQRASTVIYRMGAASDATRKDLGKMGDQADRTADQIDGYRKAVDEALEAVLESTFGPKEYALELKGAKGELADHLKHLDRLRDIKDPTKEQRQDIHDTKLEVIDDRKEVARLETRLAELGKISLDQLQDEFVDLGIDISRTNSDVGTLLRNLARLPGVTIPGGGSGQTNSGLKKQFARGGYLPPGGSGDVGEHAPESIYAMPGGGVYVVPDQGGGGGRGSGSVVVHSHLYLDGREIARSVGEHSAYEAARAPQSAF